MLMTMMLSMRTVMMLSMMTVMMLSMMTVMILQVRKKGRNKQHATNCRSRKESEVKLLQVKTF